MLDDVAMPSQTQLALPLLECLNRAGGYAKPGQLYDEIARSIGLSDAARNATVTLPTAGTINRFERGVRWTRQTLVARGLISRETRGRWELTDKANAQLRNIVRGAMITVFETDRGFCINASAEDVVAIIEKNSVELLLTSPPYPLLRQKEYSRTDNRPAREWTEWMLKLAEGWRELLTPSGSMMINIGPVWEPGNPRCSTYVERFLIRLEDELDLFLCQRLSWESRTKLPVPMEWVAKRRLRVKDTIEPILWVAPDPARVASNNMRVLKPYSDGALRAIANPQDGTHTRPSGFTFGPSSFVDSGGAIPSANIISSNAASNSPYRRAERAAGRIPHPATMPADVAAFCISLATEEEDTVFDPFGGSGTTAAACERLNRHWILGERSREYCESARIRFEAEGLHPRPLVAA